MERKRTKEMHIFSAPNTDYQNSDVWHKDYVDLKDDDDKKEVSFRNERWNIALLFFLYVLQGVPLGLGGSIPIILQNQKISYKQQALFSFVTWPFSIKLLWAPIVDSIYWPKMGRRKTWLIPIQYVIGITMIILSSRVTSLLGSEESEPNVLLLTAAFLFLNFLAATQDIAVDGWALTMLSRQNVGYASTCNSVGQTAGFFLGNVVFLALESANFCNTYLRYEPKPEGIVTLPSFLMFWGFVFLTTTTMVLILKREKQRSDDDVTLNIVDTYKSLYRIMCLPSVWTMIIFLMTFKIGFAATDAATGLKLIEAGVQKEHLALMAVPMVPLQIFLPFYISRYTVGPRPLTILLKAYPYRLAFGIVFAALLWWTRLLKQELGEFPLYYYAVILSIYAVHQVTVNCVFVAIMAFFAKVSDPSIGGTYMTLLNTLCNLGGNWCATLALWWLDPLTSKRCDSDAHSCDTKELVQECENVGGHCITVIDGYYILTVFCIGFGFLWLRWGKPAANRLQQLPMSAWSY